MNRLVRGGRAALNRYLHWQDLRPGMEVSQALAHSPLFIVGPPRCGSTLLYQVLTEAFDLAYVSNVHEFVLAVRLRLNDG